MTTVNIKVETVRSLDELGVILAAAEALEATVLVQSHRVSYQGSRRSEYNVSVYVEQEEGPAGEDG